MADVAEINYLASQPHILRIEKDHKLSLNLPRQRYASSPLLISLDDHHSKKLDKHDKEKKKKNSKKEKLKEVEKEKQIDNLPWNIAACRRNFNKPSSRISASSSRLQPVRLYIMDTGVEDNHPDLPRVVNSKSFIKNKKNGEIDSQGDKNRGSSKGHGSHIAGIACGTGLKKISGICGTCDNSNNVIELHSIQILDEEGNGSISVALAAIEWLTTEKMRNMSQPMVVNLSLGFDSETTEYNSLDEAIERAIQKGIVFVIAAGNDGLDAKTFSPAHVFSAITVSSWGRCASSTCPSPPAKKNDCEEESEDDETEVEKEERKNKKIKIKPRKINRTRGIISYSDRDNQNDFHHPKQIQSKEEKVEMKPFSFQQQSSFSQQQSFPQTQSSWFSQQLPQQSSFQPRIPQQAQSFQNQQSQSFPPQPSQSFPPHSLQPPSNESRGVQGGTQAPLYNWGETVDILAPGVDILSTWTSGGYKVESGTSMSTPHVSGAACLYLFLHPDASPNDVKYFLLNSGKISNEIKGLKPGTPNLLLHLPDDFISDVEKKLSTL